MAIKIIQYFTNASIIQTYVTEAQPQLHVRDGRLIVDLPTLQIYMSRNGRIEIEADHGDR